MGRVHVNATERGLSTRQTRWMLFVLLFFLLCCSCSNLLLFLKADREVTFVYLQLQEFRSDAPLEIQQEHRKTNTTTAAAAKNDNDTNTTGLVTEETNANDESFSACIMWADDNFRLEEWLAYHYYIMKLRYVVVDIDANNKTSVDAILDRWNDAENKYNLNMTIVVMRDRDYVRNYDDWMAWREKERLALGEYGGANTKYLIYRQMEFYRACSNHLIQQNKSWTSFHDTDEYITFDHHEINGRDITAKSSRKMEQPGYVLNRLNEIKERYPPDKYGNETGLSCLVVERRKYCATEMSTEEATGLLVPSIDPSTGTAQHAILPEGLFAKERGNALDAMRRFDTLRYKYLIDGADGRPKSIIDLSQTNPRLYVQDKWDNKDKLPWSPHQVMRWLCRRESSDRLKEVRDVVQDENFIIGHYLGSFQSFSFRDDARKGFHKNYDSWKNQSSNTLGEHSHVVRPWLRGFVELVGGPDVASYLLQDAGKFPENYNITEKIHEYRVQRNNSIGFDFK